MMFTKTHSAKRGTSTYKSDEGLTIYVPKSAGEHPEMIEIDGLTVPVKSATSRVVGPKASKEERVAAATAEKARFAGLSPEQKAQEMRDKANAKREAAAKALAAAEERLRKISAAA